MTLLVLIVLAGFVAAAGVGGTLGGWKSVRVYWWPGALLALALQLVLYNPPIETQPWALAYGPYLFILAKALLMAVLVKNAVSTNAAAYRSAWAIAALGVGLNPLVVSANGGFMPQSTDARVAARGTTLYENDAESSQRLTNVKPMDDATRL